MTRILIGFTIILLGAAWFLNSSTGATEEKKQIQGASDLTSATAIFAGGCFWCTEADYEKLGGVISAKSGYTGGFVDNPTYRQVSRENTGHFEAVEVTYDPASVTYKELVDFFFRSVDPLDDGGQFCDRGESYRTAIFVLGDDERNTAIESKLEAEKILGKTIVTPILERVIFYDAEDYHQDYYKKNPLPYKYYRTSCGRDRRIRQLWGEKN